MAKKKKVINYFYYVFWSIILIFFAITLFSQLQKFNKLVQEKDALITLISDEEKKAKLLSVDKSYYESDEFIEKIANELGFIKPDEYIFINDAKVK